MTFGKRALFATLFFLSGASALIYEVVWIRELRVLLGSTVASSSIVFGSFLAGLALGAVLARRWVGRIGGWRAGILVYCGIELVLALVGMVSIDVIHWLDAAYLAAQSSGVVTHSAVSTAAVAAGLLLLPTTLMGMTLPLLIRIVAPAWRRSPGEVSGFLYGINTLGAATGSSAAGFLLIPALGLRDTAAVAASLNLIIAVGFFLQSRAPVTMTGGPEPDRDASMGPRRRGVLGLWLMAGFVTLSVEILYLRFLLPIIGISTFAVSTVLTFFIVGMGLGSVVGAKLLARARPQISFGLIQGALGLVLALQIAFLDGVPVWFARLFVSLGHDFPAAVGSGVLLAAGILLLPTLLLGMCFPVVVSWQHEGSNDLASSTAIVYAVGTVGNVLGALVTPFVLVPLFGIQGTYIFAASLSTAIALSAIWPVPGRSWRIALPLLAALVLVFGHQPWNLKRLSTGIFYKAKSLGQDHDAFWRDVDARTLLYYHEGPAVTVSVDGGEAARILRIEGKPVASSTGSDLRNQHMLALIPYLIKGRTPRGLVIGMGTGVTCGTLSLVTDRVECVELSREVLAATDLYGDVNANVRHRLNVDVTIDDGRRFVRANADHYDVITADPIHPWAAGSSSLYSVEHFAACRARLTPDGIMTQWLPLYELAPTDVLMVLRSFAEVFPYVYVWNTYDDSILVGSNVPWSLQPKAYADRAAAEEIAGLLEQIHVNNALNLASGFSADRATVMAATTEIEVNSEDRPQLEFTAPQSLYRMTVPENLTLFLGLRKLYDSAPPVEDTEPGQLDSARLATSFQLRGWSLERLGRLRGAAEYYVSSVRECVRCGPALADLRRLLARWFTQGDLNNIQRTLGALLAAGHDLRDHWRRVGVERLRRGENPRAIEVFERLLMSPDVQAGDHVNLGFAYQRQGRLEQARQQYGEALTLDPDNRHAAHNLDLLPEAPAPEPTESPTLE